MGRIEKRYAGYCRPGAQILRLDPQCRSLDHHPRSSGRRKWQYQNEGLLDRTHLNSSPLTPSARCSTRPGCRYTARSVGATSTTRDSTDWIADTKITPRKEDASLSIHRSAPFKPGIEIEGKTSLLNGPAMPRYVEVSLRSHIHAVTAEECCAPTRIHEPFAAMRTIPEVTCTTEIHDRMPDIFISSNAIATLLICRKNSSKLDC